jgi:hypothetical protein
MSKLANVKKFPLLWEITNNVCMSDMRQQNFQVIERESNISLANIIKKNIVCVPQF